MTNAVIQPSFSKGEVSPSLYGRVDLAAYKTGLARCRNFLVDYRGGIRTRPGTQYIGTSNNSVYPSRLIPFTFSTLNTYMLEFSQNTMRVILNGAYVLEPTVAIAGVSQANPGVVFQAAHGFTSGQSVYFSGVGGMTQLNGNTYLVLVIDPNTYSLQYLGSAANVDTTTFGAYTAGGTSARVYTQGTPYTAIDLSLLKFTQSNDTMTLTHPHYPPTNLTRTQHWVWTFTTLSFAATIAPPVAPTLTTTAAGTTQFAYLATAVDVNGQESIPSNSTTISSVNISTTAGSVTMTLAAGVAGVNYYNWYKTQVAVGSVVPPGSSFGFIGLSYGLSFVDSNITADFAQQPPRHQNPFAPSAVQRIAISNGGTGYANTLTASISDPSGTGAKITPILDGSGVILAFIVLNGGQGYTAPTVVLSGVGPGTGFVGTVIVGPAAGTYPGCVTYHQQRKIYANTLNQPSTLFMSKPGSFNNFDSSNPITDGDAITVTLAARELNAIQSMLSMPGGLVVFTSGGVWQVSSGAGANAPITPSSGVATPQAYHGSSGLIPIPINYDILYVQTKGSIVRNLQYNLFANIYTSTDTTVLSNHLFGPRVLTDWAYAEDPFKIVWMVRDDGQLISMTYLKEQELIGFGRHDTQGVIESVATVQEGNTDAVYMIVGRLINGVYTRFTERMVSQYFTYGIEDSWCVDCGLSLGANYPNATVNIFGVSGLGVLVDSSPTAIFSNADIGKVFRANGGIAVVASCLSPTSITVNYIRNAQTVISGEGYIGDQAFQRIVGLWTLDSLVTTLSGLNHLEGRSVAVLADGISVGPKTVVGGKITLTTPATRVTVGLGFQAQAQTLDLDPAGMPTVQGKRKKLTAVTLRVENEKGLKVGSIFDSTLVPLKDTTHELFEGDLRVILNPRYDLEGRVCIQQDLPLPATVLAVIPEILIGDN